LKIEGRARSPEYVYTVVECYREAAEAYFDNSFSDEKIASWNERLASVFNRGFWDGYYLGQRLGEWSNNYGSMATQRKVYVGKGVNYFSNLKVAEFKLETGPLKVGDEIFITGPTTGLVKTIVEEIQLEKQSVVEAPKGSYISIPMDTKIRKSDKMYKIVDAAEIKQQ
jgi:putative protease